MKIKKLLTRNVIYFSTVLFVIIATLGVIRYAKGYRPTLNGEIRGTGLLATNSFPEGAQVYIDGKLTTATDDTLNINPKTYFVEIRKDGYHPWSKELTIEAELVTQTNATLFPTVPSLSPLTFTGAINPIPSPDGNKISFAVASASASTKNGLYTQELSSNPLAFNRSPRQIAQNTQEFDFAKATITWSPDSSEMVASFPNDRHILLEAVRFNNPSSYVDITIRLPLIFKEWEEELARDERAKLLELPDFMIKIATKSATNLYVSPDEERVLFQATQSTSIPTGLVPNLPSENTQPEDRQLTPGNFYVYDIKEDRNYLIHESQLPEVLDDQVTIEKRMLLEDILHPIPAELTSSPSAFKSLSSGMTINDTLHLFNAQYSSIHVSSIQWFPDSYHLIITTDTGIDIVEFDNTNRTTIYSGPFDKSFVYPWPNNSNLVTLIQFSPDTPPNLYAIELK